VQEIFGDSLHATANASQDEKEENGENELAALGGCYTLFHNCGDVHLYKRLTLAFMQQLSLPQDLQHDYPPATHPGVCTYSQCQSE
jgi:hypothetical protein